MINLGSRGPAGFAMTTVTGIAGTNVFCALTFGGGAIMTGGTGR